MDAKTLTELTRYQIIQSKKGGVEQQITGFIISISYNSIPKGGGRATNHKSEIIPLPHGSTLKKWKRSAKYSGVTI